MSLDDPLYELMANCVPHILVVSAGGDEELVLDVNVLLRTPEKCRITRAKSQILNMWLSLHVLKFKRIVLYLIASM